MDDIRPQQTAGHPSIAVLFRLLPDSTEKESYMNDLEGQDQQRGGWGPPDAV